MTTTVLSPKQYNGQFVTFHFLDKDFGWQMTEWWFGKPKGHAYYQTILEGLLLCLNAGLVLADEAKRLVFEQDVILGGLQ